MSIDANEESRQKILEINADQRKFYNQLPQWKHRNVIMHAWRSARSKMYFLLREAGIWHDIFSLQKEWLGDLSDKKVLDLGCYQGNALSGYLAANSRSYVGIDLSEEALARLEAFFRERGITNFKLVASDFLSDSFEERDFDIIYAQGVLHHFNPISALLPVLSAKLRDSGKIVSVDPLQTSLLTRAVRGIYHPFRQDKAWEWPFTKKTIAEIERFFVIKHVQGFVGRSKYAIPSVFLGKSFSTRLAANLHRHDMRAASRKGPALWRCLQIAMCLEKINAPSESASPAPSTDGGSATAS